MLGSWYSPPRPPPPLEDTLVGDDSREDPHGLLDLVVFDHHRPGEVVAGLVLEVSAAKGQGNLRRYGYRLWLILDILSFQKQAEFYTFFETCRIICSPTIASSPTCVVRRRQNRNRVHLGLT